MFNLVMLVLVKFILSAFVQIMLLTEGSGLVSVSTIQANNNMMTLNFVSWISIFCMAMIKVSICLSSTSQSYVYEHAGMFYSCYLLLVCETYS